MPRSFRCRASRPADGKSRLTMFVARLLSTHDAAAPCSMAATTVAGSSPAASAMAMPSATPR